jgi:oxygen-independent coproporphyrinogen-3 oxidase
VTPAYARWAAARRVRVSLGVQSFDARMRETLGRRAAADPAAAFHRLREAGVGSLGVDLIFGMPGQTAGGVDRELAALATLVPDHVSWYELTLVPGSVLAARVELTEAGRLGWEAPFLPGEDETAALYRRVVRGLGRLGYRWYEVSNFARRGRRCRHNSAVWRGGDYLGLGPAAVGTVAGRRRRNRPDLERYLAASHAAAGPFDPPHDDETLDEPARLRERLFLAARTGAGVPLAELAPALDRAALEPLAEAGFVSLRGGTLRVTRKGRYVADAVCVRLFRASSFSEA